MAMDTTILRRAAEQVVTPSELDWLHEVRRRAFDRFVSTGFPTVAEEDWRYTDLRPAAALTERYLENPVLAGPAVLPGREAALRGHMVNGLGGATAVFADGVFNAELSSLRPIPGLTIAPLGQVAPETQGVLSDRLSRAIAGGNGLTALNMVLLRDGLFIRVAAGTVLDEPIYLVLASSAKRATYNRAIITLEPESHATIVEHHIGAGESVSNSVTEVACDMGSRLAYVKLQAETAAAIHLASQKMSMAAGARASVLHLDLGAKMARNDLRLDLSGEGAEVTCHGLFYADGSRHLDNHTRIDHRAPHSLSREQYRGIADGDGRGVFNGKVIVHAGAIRSDAQLTNQNLLLSRTAEVDTKPELEIYADDVKCSHGATTGRLDSDSIFYLRSRGIAADQARRILIGAFVREIVKRVPAGPLDSHVSALLHDRLPDLEGLFASP
jgi:Fe-S cluster assembly protein SufD